MDDNQFDKLVQRLTVAPSRREAVAGLVAGALTTVGLTSVADAKGDKNKNEHKGKGRKGGKNNGKGRNGGKSHRGNDGHRDENDIEDEGDKKRRRRRRRNRCKKIGAPCGKNKKCCSKFCDSKTGQCAQKPAS